MKNRKELFEIMDKIEVVEKSNLTRAKKTIKILQLEIEKNLLFIKTETDQSMVSELINRNIGLEIAISEIKRIFNK